VDGSGGLGDRLRLLRDRGHLQVEQLLEAQLLESFGWFRDRLRLRGGGECRECKHRDGDGLSELFQRASTEIQRSGVRGHPCRRELEALALNSLVDRHFEAGPLR